MEENKQEAYKKKLDNIKDYLPVDSNYWEVLNSAKSSYKAHIPVDFYSTGMFRPTAFYKPISKIISLTKNAQQDER